VQLFTTLGRRLVDFETRDAGKVGIYVCGPTVQARPHVGHGRAAVAFDVVRRYLQWLGYEVTYVQNVTDVDDKIIAAATEQGRDAQDVALEAADAFRRAYRLLGVLDPSVEPKATDHVPEMIEMIEALIEHGHAYESEGDVYFSVRSFPGYGKLSGRRIDELQSGARIEPGEHKRDPLDFALWKAAKPGEPRWDSPWGEGRPGWHIECSAMARRYLGEGFDLHAGGNDLVFPHHENEIAQAEAASGATFARYWIHNGMVNLSGEKMAKSTGHIVDLLTALEQYPPLAVRLFYLRTHYRKPLEFSEAALEDAANSLERLWAFRRRLPGPTEATADPAYLDRFRDAAGNDFDMAGALAVLFDLVREGNTRIDEGGDAGSLVAAYDDMVRVLGLEEPSVALDDLRASLAAIAERHGIDAQDPEELIEALLALRHGARAARQWQAADEIRDALDGVGIVIEDTADGARWPRG
jgi:cysteinyl-tRNA synthetase